MNENTTNTPLDRIEERRRRRAARGSLRDGGGWIGGAILILIGLLLFGQNLGFAALDNWWALFILLPALGSFSTAWRLYQAAGRFTMHARSAFIVGFVLTLVTASFLINLNWIYLGPALLILAGVGLLVNFLLPA